MGIYVSDLGYYNDYVLVDIPNGTKDTNIDINDIIVDNKIVFSPLFNQFKFKKVLNTLASACTKIVSAKLQIAPT